MKTIFQLLVLNAKFIRFFNSIFPLQPASALHINNKIPFSVQVSEVFSSKQLK